MAVTDQHPADQHSTGHGVDPAGVDPAGVDPAGVDPAGVDPAGVDPAGEPSADWGWHGSFPLAGPIAGWFTAFALFAMLIGNHQSRVEDIWLIGLGLLLVVMLVGHHLKRRKARRRWRT